MFTSIILPLLRHRFDSALGAGATRIGTFKPGQFNLNIFDMMTSNKSLKKTKKKMFPKMVSKKNSKRRPFNSSLL